MTDLRNIKEKDRQNRFRSTGHQRHPVQNGNPGPEKTNGSDPDIPKYEIPTV